jgi:hypothetical protein
LIDYLSSRTQVRIELDRQARAISGITRGVKRYHLNFGKLTPAEIVQWLCPAIPSPVASKWFLPPKWQVG